MDSAIPRGGVCFICSTASSRIPITKYFSKVNTRSLSAGGLEGRKKKAMSMASQASVDKTEAALPAPSSPTFRSLALRGLHHLSNQTSCWKPFRLPSDTAAVMREPATARHRLGQQPDPPR
ncbi:hypothetical protein P3342_013360 [Pyrenophora teres f. teres]|nr:hypothetical protein P3342_013360 [Pyrenophora teres f. teres]